jgi:hypothetical protein
MYKYDDDDSDRKMSECINTDAPYISDMTEE